jgi:hypothetical protein
MGGGWAPTEVVSASAADKGLRSLRAGGPSPRTRVDPLAEVWESEIIPTDPLAGRSPGARVAAARIVNI